MLLVELDNRIGQHVAHVDQTTLFDALRVLPQHQPTNVGEEEAPVRVVRVGIGFGVLVMDSVIPDPIVQTVLTGHAVAAHQDDAQWKLGLVGPMCPQAVSSAGNAKTGATSNNET